jgi:enterochelin esterase-like enzyme
MGNKLILLFVIILSPLCLSAQDFSGRYSGTVGFEQGHPQPVFMVLQFHANTVRGALGGNEHDLERFDGGTVDEGNVSFKFQGFDIVLHFQESKVTGSARQIEKPSSSFPIELHRIGDLTSEDRVPPLVYEDGGNRSPGIIALREAIQHGDRNAVSTFWARILQSGAPIIEPVPDDQNLSLVTFLWRGSDNTKSAMLIRGRFTAVQPAWQLFSHIEGTDVWFKTLKLPRASRLTYGISENDPEATLPPGTSVRRVQYDPLNPHHVPDEPEAPRERWQSLLELPDAPSQPWYVKHPDVPHLTMKKEHFHSEILKEDRDVLVYTPLNYQPKGASYPTLYLFDGEDNDGLVFATQTIENLISQKRISPLVVVRIINPSQEIRNKELACMPEFAEFLHKELLPFVRERYHVTHDPSRTAIGGYSMGGLGAAYAGLRHPESFGLLLIQSGSFWWEPTMKRDIQTERNWIAREFIRSPKLPLRLYMEAGLFEVDLRGEGGNILDTSRDLRNVLLAKGYRVTYHEFAGDHDYMNWRGTLADGLIDLFNKQPNSSTEN